MTGATVLVVDDQEEILELMRDFLEDAGFRVATAVDAAQALAVLRSSPVDCLLLDIMMPGTSGFELCRQVRHARDVPIVFLTARDADEDKIRGLGLGADDYVVKSASAGEVVARVRAVLRRYWRGGTAGPGLLDFGRLRIDVRAAEVHVDGRPVSLTAREFGVLRLLAEHPRQVFSRGQLLERVWGTHGDGHTVTVTIANLRGKIEERPAAPRHIVTVRGIGYRFEGGA